MPSRIDTAMSQAEDATAAIFRNFENSAGCSMEQIFSPVSIRKSGFAQQPGFRPPFNVNRNENGRFNLPFSQRGTFVGPTVRELNPYFPSNIIAGDEDGSEFFNTCDYNAVVMSPSSDMSRQKTDVSIVEEVRTKGLRTPIILSGWGFDVCDKPVPSGPLSSDGPTFHSNVASDRRTWKTGPLHVMWDDERQVWTGGTQILHGVVVEPMGSINGVWQGYAYVQVMRENSRPPGEPRSDLTSYGESIVCSVRDPNLWLRQGTWVVAARINYEWVIIQSSEPSVYYGTFEDFWPKGNLKDVTLVKPVSYKLQTSYPDPRRLPEPATQPVYEVRNLFATVGDRGILSSCAFTYIDGDFYLIAAECDGGQLAS